ncbi:MAG: multiple sugar transport system substrate-binding protein [Kosmotogales bacterium]|nr:multiple sugar transport system substrate-binding protein [Kosmotogales bacterium]
MKRVLLVLLCMFFIVSFSYAVTTVRITGWPGNPTEEGVIMDIVEEFNATHDDIQAVWEPLPGDYRQMIITQFSAGTAPDLFYVDVSYFDEFAINNMLQPLDLYVKKDGFDIEDFYEPLIDGFKLNNRLYGLPKDYSTLALFYNKEMFDEYGVEYPTSSDTWEDFLNKALALKEAGLETPLVLAADLNRMLPFVEQAGGVIVNEDLTTGLTSEEARKGWEMYIDLVTKYDVADEPANLGAGWIGEAFGKEACAMAMSGPWSLGFLEGTYPDVYEKTGVVELPMDVERATMIYTVCWAINRQSENKDAAWEVLKYLTNEGQAKFVEGAGVLASRKSIAKTDTAPMKEAFYAGAAYGTAWKIKTPSGIFSMANDQINSMLKDLFYEKITIDEALERIENNYDSWVE